MIFKPNVCNTQKSFPHREAFYGGRNRTRTCDPIDVNDVLYQLSHATMPSLDDENDYSIRAGKCQRKTERIFRKNFMKKRRE